MEYDIDIKNTAIDTLKIIKSKLPKIHKQILERLTWEVVSISQKKYLTGGNPLNVRTGRLRKGMYQKVTGTKGEVGNNVIYAKTHESEKVSDRTIVPVRAKKLFVPLKPGVKPGKKGLKFGVDFVLSKKVVMPHRPFIRPAIRDVMETDVVNRIIIEALNAEFQRAAEEAGSV